jgi:prephenate dehydrogenase
MITFMRVGVYGLGRFGSFWAKCLAEHHEVLGYSRNPERTVPSRVRRVNEDEILTCEALFLCVSISAMEEVVGSIGDRVENGTVVLDTCSVKVHPVDVMRRSLSQGVEIIGTHPMFGPDSGKNGVTGLPLVFCPVRARPEVCEYWRDQFTRMGLCVHELSAENHDREAAFTQGITHFMGRVLDDLDLGPSPIGTKGYEKLLEIIEQTCNDPYQLFVDLQRYNPFTEEMRERLTGSLQKMQAQLELHRIT